MWFSNSNSYNDDAFFGVGVCGVCAVSDCADLQSSSGGVAYL